MFSNQLLKLSLLSTLLLGACAGGEGIGGVDSHITNPGGDPTEGTCEDQYAVCLSDGNSVEACKAVLCKCNDMPLDQCVAPEPGTTTDQPTTDPLPTTTDLPTGGSGESGNMTTGVSDTDASTGDACMPLSCEIVQSNNNPDGAFNYDPDCNQDTGPTRVQVATVVSQGWLAQVPTLDDCFNGQGGLDPEAFTQWLLGRHLGFSLEEWNQPADTCLLEQLGSFNPTLPLWSLDQSQPVECNVGWGQVKQVTADYCFSGASTDGSHIGDLQIINDVGDGLEFPNGGYLKSADLFCDPTFQYGFLSQLLIGGGVAQFDTDCHTPDGVGGKARIQVDLNDDGGNPDDPSYKFRFVVTGGSNLNVVGPTDQQVCDLI